MPLCTSLTNLSPEEKSQDTQLDNFNAHILTLEGIGGGGGGFNLTPLDFFGSKFLFLDRLPNAFNWHNCSLLVTTTFDPN